MLQLTERYGEGPVFLSDIAKKENISEKYLSKIVIPLRHGGLISAIRGAQGGYLLARTPEEITVKDIVRLLEEGAFTVECVYNEELCERSEDCVARNVWARLENAMYNTLAAFTLEDMLEGNCTPLPKQGEEAALEQ